MKNNDVKNNALIVFTPGWDAKLSRYSNVLRSIEDRLKEDELASSWNWEIIKFHYNNNLFSLDNPSKIAENLVDFISIHLRKNHNHFDKIFLLGHSLGALIVRKAVLLAYKNDDNKKWLENVHIVLLAGANRGYSIDSLPFGIQVLAKFTSRIPFLVQKGMRGSECVNEIRLSWLRTFANPEESNYKKPTAPPTIQLIGSRDRLVKREDSFDIYRFSNTVEIEIEGATHSGFIDTAEEQVINNVIVAFKRHLQGNYKNSPNDIVNILSRELIEYDSIIFLVHGIRDFADWHKTLAHLITQKSPLSRVVSVRFGYFTALQFLLPLQRRKNIRVFIDQYIQELAEYPNIPVHVVAHSYGTYIFAQAMKQQSGINVNRIYMAGSVLPGNFNWQELSVEKRFDAIRNDCANGDWAVGVLSKYLCYLPWNWGDIGTAGIDGFSRNNGNVISNQYLEGGHGSALDFPITQEIVEFLFADSKNLGNASQLRNLRTTKRQKAQLIRLSLAFFVLIAASIAIFASIIFFVSMQWLAVILAIIVTACIFWFLLSI